MFFPRLPTDPSSPPPPLPAPPLSLPPGGGRGGPGDARHRRQPPQPPSSHEGRRPRRLALCPGGIRLRSGPAGGAARRQPPAANARLDFAVSDAPRNERSVSLVRERKLRGGRSLIRGCPLIRTSAAFRFPFVRQRAPL